jgi:NAD-dependent deacetylase
MEEEGVLEPTCDACGGPLKPKTISFGQAMPEAETRRAFMEAAASELLIAIGSSLVVFPAASLVPAAKQAGAGVILVNRTPTGYDEIADAVLRGAAGVVLPAILAALPA